MRVFLTQVQITKVVICLLLNKKSVHSIDSSRPGHSIFSIQPSHISGSRRTSPNSSTKMSTIGWLNVRGGKTLNTSIIDPAYYVNGEPPVCIARAWHAGHLLPGYVRLSNHTGYFVHRREVVKKMAYQLLLVGSLEWQEVGEGEPVPENAVKVGKTCRGPLFLGKADVNGEDLLGMVTDSVCSIATDERVFETRRFSILVQVKD
ncbi:Hypothetical predicted protein [Cloeon dipterum]|uniref:Uncharacterized protein n=1 Tax=Cloeon dipterum TaxID=197152 RepID=A0A8S1DV95_9INSE|nr:Hypothetical predicted protein [Cloeon dipterum]